MSDNYLYSNVSVYNPVTGHTVVFNDDIQCDAFNKESVVDEYVITEADVLAALNNEGNLAPQDIQVSCSGEQGTIIVDSRQNFLNVYASNLISEHYEPFISLSFTMNVSNTIVMGDTCQGIATISNLTKTTVRDITVVCSLSNSTQTFSLAPEEVKQLTYQYVITEDDLYAGMLPVAISANGTSFAETPVSASKQYQYSIGSATTKISLIYTDATTNLAVGEYALGDTITYKATATNNGNVNLYNIAFHDNDTNLDYTHAVLAPGESVAWTFTKTFEQSNVALKLKGTISAQGKNDNAASATVQPLRCYVDYSIIGWAYKVAVDSSTNLKSSVPFSLFNQPNIELYIDWGDGTTDVLTPSMYSSATSTLASVHTYATAGEYTIQIDSSDWSNTYIFSYGTNYTTSGISVADQYACIGYFKSTVIEILNAIPGLKGTNCYSSTTTYGTSTTRFGNPFQSCSKLEIIPNDLFSNMPTTFTNYSYCFSSCTALAEIPEGLFDALTQNTNFQGCFSSCSSITEIPEGLFDHCTKATVFWSCFQGCTSLQTIPEHLFLYNTAANDFDECFRGCSSLTDFTIHISARSISYCSNFVTLKSGTTRTIYVPSGSNTLSKFNSVASSLGLTVIGE